MLRTVTATEARRHFGQLMRDVIEHNDIFVVERTGTPQIVIMSIAEYERRGGKLTYTSEHEESTSERAT